MEFLPSFFKRQFAGKQAVVSKNCGCFLKLQTFAKSDFQRTYVWERQVSEKFMSMDDFEFEIHPRVCLELLIKRETKI